MVIELLTKFYEKIFMYKLVAKFAESSGHYNLIMFLYVLFVILGLPIVLVLILKKVSKKSPKNKTS